MVDDFNELSAVVTNPVERLRLKQFVKKHTKSANPFEQTISQYWHWGRYGELSMYLTTLHYGLYHNINEGSTSLHPCRSEMFTVTTQTNPRIWM